MDIGTDTPCLHFSMNRLWAFFPLTCHLLKTHIILSTFSFRFPVFSSVLWQSISPCWFFLGPTDGEGEEKIIWGISKNSTPIFPQCWLALGRDGVGLTVREPLTLFNIRKKFLTCMSFEEIQLLMVGKENRISHWKRLQWKVSPRNWVLQIQCKWTRRQTQFLQLGARSLSAS